MSLFRRTSKLPTLLLKWCGVQLPTANEQPVHSAWQPLCYKVGGASGRRS
jgi:hypothetical protein